LNLLKFKQKSNEKILVIANIRDRFICNAAIEFAEMTGALSGSAIGGLLTIASGLKL
jgi:hypothetical protein